MEEMGRTLKQNSESPEVRGAVGEEVAFLRNGFLVSTSGHLVFS